MTSAHTLANAPEKRMSILQIDRSTATPISCAASRFCAVARNRPGPCECDEQQRHDDHRSPPNNGRRQDAFWSRGNGHLAEPHPAVDGDRLLQSAVRHRSSAPAVLESRCRLRPWQSSRLDFKGGPVTSSGNCPARLTVIGGSLQQFAPAPIGAGNIREAGSACERWCDAVATYPPSVSCIASMGPC